MNPTSSTIAPKHPTGAAGNGTASAGKGLSAFTRLHMELDGIASRPTTDNVCRESLLDCLLRSQSYVGGAWSSVRGEHVTTDISRLHGPVFDRPETKRWLANLAIRATNERADIVSTCPHIRNLQAVCVPVRADRRTQLGPGESTPVLVYPDLVLTLVSTVNETTTATDLQLAAGQCTVRAWRDWFAQSGIRELNVHLAATSVILELSSRVVSAASKRAAQQLLVNELANHFDARFVALGQCRVVNGQGAKLVAVSNIGDIDPNSQQAGRLEAALSETVIRNELTRFPAINASEQHQHLAHKRSAETFGVDAVISVPLTNDAKETTGALLLGGMASQLFRDETRNVLLSASRPLGSALAVAESVEGGVIRKLGRRISRLIRGAKGQLMLAACAAVTAAMFLPVSYRISCHCVVEPTTRRYCIAPYDGLLENTLVEPGDHVSSGDLLARMEGRELGWELAGVVADEQRVNKEENVHRSRLEIAESLIAELEGEKLEAREDLLRHRLTNLELRSPIDGIVLSGSFDRRENYPVTVGQTIYEIAPVDELRVEVAVPAAERSYVSPGMVVSIRIDGRGDEAIAGTISRILPRSEIREQQNVFVAEVIVPNPNGDLRPGMEGTAKITSSEKSLGWTIGHHAWERIVTRVWW
ncbi:MAG: HlyD family efflux transporter periplasmic adaptor subunit [Planctomycetaceae bacterium]